MDNQIFYKATPQGVVLYLDGGAKTINLPSSDKNFMKVVALLRGKQWDEVRAIVAPPAPEFTTSQDTTKTIRELIEGTVHLYITPDNTVMLTEKINGADVEVHGAILARMVDALSLGLPISPFLAFIERLHKNPSFKVHKQLFDFLDKCDHPILPDGRFLAYKSVRTDRYDAHTGHTFKNEDGAVIEMPRHAVDDNPSRTCSSGLHVCSRGYGFFSQILLEVIVAPEDVVAVPVDYNHAKMRVCKYEVVGEVKDYADWGGKPIYGDDGDNYDYEDEDYDDSNELDSLCGDDDDYDDFEDDGEYDDEDEESVDNSTNVEVTFSLKVPSRSIQEVGSAVNAPVQTPEDFIETLLKALKGVK